MSDNFVMPYLQGNTPAYQHFECHSRFRETAHSVLCNRACRHPPDNESSCSSVRGHNNE